MCYNLLNREGDYLKPRIVFMGTPMFAVPILEALIEKYDVIMVVCQPDRKKNRKGVVEYPEVKSVAMRYGIDVFQPLRIKDDYEYIIDANPDLVITCAYGQIVPTELLLYPKLGCINVHGSILPELRGGAPIHWAIIRGYKETGITIMDMSPKMDAGDIIATAKISISDDMILDELYEKMSYLGRDLLIDTLPNIINRTAKRVKQDETRVTYAYNISKEDAKIDFSKTSREIRNLVRGLNSNPGAYCYLDNKRIKIYEVEEAGKTESKEYGKIVEITKDSIICVAKDNLLKIKCLAVEGKKKCLVKDYVNGIKKEKLIGKVLGSEKK